MAGTGTAGKRPGQEGPIKVVVVDDDAVSLGILTTILESDGHEVRTFQDPGQALASMRQAPPEVLIVDWLMPRMDGPDLLREVRADPALQGIYCVLVTAFDEKGRKVTGLLVGADDYLTKPVSQMELLARIRVGIRVRRLERQTMLLATAVTLGHEVNNPLTGVLGFLDLAKEQVASGDREGALANLRKIEEAALRIQSVVGRFLAQDRPRLKDLLPGRPTKAIDIGEETQPS